MVLEVEILDLLNFDNFVFYVSFVFIIVCVYVIYKKKRFERLRLKWVCLSFIVMGFGFCFVKKNKFLIRLIVF